MADLAGFYGRCSWNGWPIFICRSFMQSYGVFCVLPITQAYCNSPRPSLRFAWFQRCHPLHPTLQSSTTITPPSIQQTDAPLRVSKAFKKGRRKKNNEIQIGIHCYRMNKLILMLVLFGNQQNCITQRRWWWCIADNAMSSCTMTYVFVSMFVFLHTHKQTAQCRRTHAAELAMIWWEGNVGRKDRKRRRKKRM